MRLCTIHPIYVLCTHNTNKRRACRPLPECLSVLLLLCLFLHIKPFFLPVDIVYIPLVYLVPLLLVYTDRLYSRAAAALLYLYHQVVIICVKLRY